MKNQFTRQIFPYLHRLLRNRVKHQITDNTITSKSTFSYISRFLKLWLLWQNLIITKLKIDETDFSAIFLNILSLPLHIKEFKTLFQYLENEFDFISIYKSRITKNDSLTTNIDVPGNNMKLTPTESKSGGCLLYIQLLYLLSTSKWLIHIHSPKQLESVFTEVSFLNTKNQITGTIYKHPSMNASIIYINNDYLKTVLNKIPNYSKNILLMGDFNVNLSNYNKKKAHATF